MNFLLGFKDNRTTALVMRTVDLFSLRILAVALLAGDASALYVGRAHASTRRKRAPLAQCCICINCKWVDRCKTYHWVEKMHGQPHLTHAPDFDPYDPQMQVFIRNEGTDGADDSTDNMQSVQSVVLSTEYDVFGCDAFTEDNGKWVGLVPDAEFIPT